MIEKSRQAAIQGSKPRWRDVYAVHPACEAFPPRSQDELRELGENIRSNGLLERIHIFEIDNIPYVYDGRSRLDGMELFGLLPWGKDGKLSPDILDYHLHVDTLTNIEVASKVIALNTRHRPFTEKQRVESSLKAFQAEEKFLEKRTQKLGRSFSPTPGERGGSTKGLVGQVATAAGVSRETARKYIDAAAGKPAPAKKKTVKPEPKSKSEIDAKAERADPRIITDENARAEARRFVTSISAISTESEWLTTASRPKILKGCAKADLVTSCRCALNSAKILGALVQTFMHGSELGDTAMEFVASDSKVLQQLLVLRKEIARRRKENKDERNKARWNPGEISKGHQSDLLNYIEFELDKLDFGTLTPDVVEVGTDAPAPAVDPARAVGPQQPSGGDASSGDHAAAAERKGLRQVSSGNGGAADDSGGAV
jgi:hypothetical protein